MKNTFLKFAGVTAVALALVQSLQATPITGNIGFTGRVALNTGSAATASSVLAWINPNVNGTSGSFNSVATGTPVTFSAPPWAFNSGSVTAFWTVGGFTFDLTESSVTAQGGNQGTTAFVNVSGSGTVYGNNYDKTTIIWNFSTQDPKIVGDVDSFTFSASHVATPDGASTIALLGLALSGAGMLRKKFAA